MCFLDRNLMSMKEEERERGNKEIKINKDTNTLNYVRWKGKCKVTNDYNHKDTVS